MGLRNYIAEKAVEKSAEVGARAAVSALQATVNGLGVALGRAVDAMGDAMESRAIESDAKYIAKRPKNRRFVIEMDEDDKGTIYVEIIDAKGRVHYTGTGKLSKIAISLIVKAPDGEAVAKIKKSMVAVRNPLKHEDKPADYSITCNDGAVFTVKTTNEGYQNFEIEPYGWITEISGSDYTVMNDEEILFYYSHRLWHAKTTYMVDFNPRMDLERLSTLITLVFMLHEKWGSLVR